MQQRLLVLLSVTSWGWSYCMCKLIGNLNAFIYSWYTLYANRWQQQLWTHSSSSSFCKTQEKDPKSWTLSGKHELIRTEEQQRLNKVQTWGANTCRPALQVNEGHWSSGPHHSNWLNNRTLAATANGLACKIRSKTEEKLGSSLPLKQQEAADFV